jgi:hypothetical protein
LQEADGILNLDSIVLNPLHVKQEGKGLLDVGQKKVEDEEDELVRSFGLDSPFNQAVREKRQESSGG